MSIITRFAPSPTGFLHIGGARTALFNYLFSKHNNGKFLLRIEDTDQKRSTAQAIDAIISGLEWLGLKHDGEIVMQSQNLERHKKIALELLEKNQAYYCYTAAEELEEMRKAAEKKGEVFRFKSQWRDKNLSQASSVKPVIRIKAPLVGETVIKDLVQGEIKVANSELDDLVMLRGDGTPTYMLAVVVDDHDMNITHIIRGDDHLTNAFRQKIIYQALGWNVPEFAHIPLIYGSDGTKMSKRHGATGVSEYQQMGYLPEAMRNYLLRLGWSHGNDEIISDENAIKWFGLEQIGKSPARFDFAKLDNLNKHYIRQKSESELLKLIKEIDPDWYSDYCKESDRDRILKVIKVFKDRATHVARSPMFQSSIDALSYFVEPFCGNASFDFSDQDKKSLVSNKDLILKIRSILSNINDDEWNADKIKNELKDFQIKEFGPVLKVALKSIRELPGNTFVSLELLEKTETLRRLDWSLQQN